MSLALHLGKSVGETVLYFGCRKKDQDFLYADEIKRYLEDKTLTEVHLAFSREQPEKVYVTHLLKENATEVWNLLGEKNGHVYICG